MSLFILIAKEEAKILLIGSVLTVGSLYWCVVGGEYELDMYPDGRSRSLIHSLLC